MRILVDTNALIWWIAKPDRLTRHAYSVLQDSNNELLVSMVSIWETAIKIGKGKLTEAGSSVQYILDEMKEQQMQMLPITLNHVRRVEFLEPHHGDPFDRLLIAQALEEKLPVVTVDAHFRDYDVKIIW